MIGKALSGKQFCMGLFDIVPMYKYFLSCLYNQESPFTTIKAANSSWFMSTKSVSIHLKFLQGCIEQKF